MIRKLIGSAEVKNGKVDFTWDIGEGTLPGKRKIWVSYVENDGYMLGEAYEQAYIRSPTSISLDINKEWPKDSEGNPIIDKTSPDYINYDDDGIPIRSIGDTITLKANVENTRLNEKVNEGLVKFEIKTEGSDYWTAVGPGNETQTVEVRDGVAQYDFEIDENKYQNIAKTTILVKATYMSNNSYGACETEELGHIKIRGQTKGNIPLIRVNKDETQPIIFYVSDKKTDFDIVNGPVAQLYFDDHNFSRVTITSKKVEIPSVTFGDDLIDGENLISGEHTLRVEIPTTRDYDGITIIGTVYIRARVEIAPTIVYAGQSLRDENNELIVSKAELPITVVTEQGVPVNEGTVTCTINGQIDVLDVHLGVASENNAEKHVFYDIPEGIGGNDTIPYTIEFSETENYQGKTVEGIIDIKNRTRVVFDEMVKEGGVIGETMLLSVRVSDMDNNENPVNTGWVEFSLEEVEGDGNIIGEGTDESCQPPTDNGENTEQGDAGAGEGTVTGDGDSMDGVDDDL